MKKRLKYYKEIERERVRQDKKWGQQNHHDYIWHLILSEEFGEISQAVCVQKFDGKVSRKDQDNLDKEIIQTAAVLIAWAESRKRNRK